MSIEGALKVLRTVKQYLIHENKKNEFYFFLLTFLM